MERTPKQRITDALYIGGVYSTSFLFIRDMIGAIESLNQHDSSEFYRAVTWAAVQAIFLAANHKLYKAINADPDDPDEPDDGDDPNNPTS